MRRAIGCDDSYCNLYLDICADKFPNLERMGSKQREEKGVLVDWNVQDKISRPIGAGIRRIGEFLAITARGAKLCLSDPSRLQIRPASVSLLSPV